MNNEDRPTPITYTDEEIEGPRSHEVRTTNGSTRVFMSLRSWDGTHATYAFSRTRDGMWEPDAHTRPPRKIDARMFNRPAWSVHTVKGVVEAQLGYRVSEVGMDELVFVRFAHILDVTFKIPFTDTLYTLIEAVAANDKDDVAFAALLDLLLEQSVILRAFFEEEGVDPKSLVAPPVDLGVRTYADADVARQDAGLHGSR